MASTSVSNITTNSATWTVSGLSNPFNTTYYMSVGIASAPFSDGASSVSSISSVSAPSSGGSTGASSTVSSLSSNTTYEWYGYARAANGLYYSAGFVIFKTLELPKLSTPSLSIGSITQTSISFTLNSVPNATTGFVDCYNNSTGAYIGLHSGSLPLSKSFTGLTPGTTYRFEYYVTAPGYQNSNAGSSFITTSSPPKLSTPSVSIGSVTSNSIGFTIGSVANATYYWVDIWNSSTGAHAGTRGSTTAFSGTFTGLSPSTSYRIEVYATADGYLDSSKGSATATTSAPPALSVPSVTITDKRYKSATVSASSANADRYIVEVYTSGGSFTTSSTSSSPITVGGLSVGTSYYVRVKAQRTDGSYSDSPWSSNNHFTTLSAPPAPQFNTGLTSKGDGYVILHWSGVSYADRYELNYRLQGNSTWLVISANIGGTSASATGLTNGQPYEFRVRAYVGDYGDWTNWSFTVVATPGLRPSDFSWTIAKVSGQPVNITAAEWKSFTDRINQFRVYKSLGNYTFTTVTASVTQVTAAIVNEAITAISPMLPPVGLPSAAVKDGTVFASFFNGLVSSLNSIQ